MRVYPCFSGFSSSYWEFVCDSMSQRRMGDSSVVCRDPPISVEAIVDDVEVGVGRVSEFKIRKEASQDQGVEVQGKAEEDVLEWIDQGEDEEVENDKVELGLIGRLWTQRNPNPNAFITTMKSVWYVKHGVDIVNIGRNLYQIQFFHWKDKLKILQGQPWHFDKFPLVLAEIDKAIKPSDLEIFYLPIWVRFYDIPFKGRDNEANAMILGNSIGRFMEMERQSKIRFEKSLGIRVQLDVREPLKESVKIRIRGGKVCILPVKYERLPLFCFYCGRMGHGSSECMEYSGDSTPERKFGVSLRASPWKKFKEEEESLPGGVDSDS